MGEAGPARSGAGAFHRLRDRFSRPAIGRQTLDLSLRNGAFVRELSDSRTFCRQADVEAMRAQGLALGGSYENAVVVDGARGAEPRRAAPPDEPVRHKMLDAMGDLAVAGAPILGRYTGQRAGHTLTGRLLRALWPTRRTSNGSRSTPRPPPTCPASASAMPICTPPPDRRKRTARRQSPQRRFACRIFLCYEKPEACGQGPG
jgi:hypothetical protein